MRIKSNPQDLHKAARKLKKLVSRKLKLKKACAPQFENTADRRRCFIRYTFKGDPLALKPALVEHGFHCEVKIVAEERVVRVTKAILHDGRVYIARLSFVPSMSRLTLSVSVE